ncbi:MAG: divergent PAP2 family protein [bacterium]|nr:divergent PAP2 family protein [bacterium]
MFAVVLVFSFLFIYDAMNLRYEAGKHARYLNSLRVELQDMLQKEKVHKYLKERLGHTPLEVIAGIFLGIFFTALLCKMFNLW